MKNDASPSPPSAFEVVSQLLAALAAGDLVEMMSLRSEDYVVDWVYGDAFENSPLSGEESAYFFPTWLGGFGEVDYEVKRTIAADDVVVTEWVFTGTHTGPLGPPIFRAMGIKTAVGSLGSLLAPALAAITVGSLPPEGAFVISAALILLTAFVVLVALRLPARTGAADDRVGTHRGATHGRPDRSPQPDRECRGSSQTENPGVIPCGPGSGVAADRDHDDVGGPPWASCRARRCAAVACSVNPRWRKVPAAWARTTISAAALRASDQDAAPKARSSTSANWSVASR